MTDPHLKLDTQLKQDSHLKQKLKQELDELHKLDRLCNNVEVPAVLNDQRTGDEWLQYVLDEISDMENEYPSDALSSECDEFRLLLKKYIQRPEAGTFTFGGFLARCVERGVYWTWKQNWA